MESKKRVQLFTSYNRPPVPPCFGETDFPSTKTQQHQENETDINAIIERYAVTGMLSNVNKGTPKFGDFTAIGDFQAVQDRILQAEASFLSLPVRVRARFHNSPAELLRFCADPANHDEAISLGLVTKPEPAAPAAPISSLLDSTNRTDTEMEVK